MVSDLFELTKNKFYMPNYSCLNAKLYTQQSSKNITLNFNLTERIN